MARSVLVTSWVFLLLCLAVSAAPTPTFPSINSSVEADCRLRGLVLEFVSSLASPETVGDWQGSAYDALQLHRCSSSLASLLATHTLPFPPRSHTPLPTAYPLRSSQRKRRSPPSPTPSPCPWEVFVDGQHGSDNNPGNLSHPLATLHHALALSRAVPRTPPSSRTVACITVRAGIYYLGDRAPTVDSSQFDSRVGAISLTSIDSGLTLRGYPGENVTLSGGVPLTSLTWAKWGGGQVRSSPLPSSSSLPALDRWHFNELYVDGQRAIPAKYPNGNPATHGLWNGLGWIPAAQSWLPPRPTPAATEVHVASPSRPDEQFSAYDMAIGGGAAVFDPPRNVWSQAAPNAGGRYVVPSGLVYSGTALQQRAVNWTDVSSGYVFALHDGHWGSWVFDIAGHSAGTQSITFGAGGFQEARGSGGGAEFYVSHILEELDDGLEWFVDYAKRTLYFQPNASTPATTLVASQLPCILSMQGTRANPIHHVTVSGITFTETANTLLRPYEVPSGGDWSVHRGGAVFVEGSEACSVTQNRFVQLAGNALVVSDYNDALDVVWNEFAWLGESAVVLLGSVDGIDGVGSYRSPMYTDVVGNLIREVGAAVKQTAGVVQFLSGASLIARNAIFNGPRAGVNINDGFYGGTELVENAMFSVVRETTDHGNINSWDRTPYLTDSGAGPSLRPLTNFITANLLLAQYHVSAGGHLQAAPFPRPQLLIRCSPCASLCSPCGPSTTTTDPPGMRTRTMVSGAAPGAAPANTGTADLTSLCSCAHLWLCAQCFCMAEPKGISATPR